MSDPFQEIEGACAETITNLAALSDASILEIPISSWFPKDHPLLRNADVSFVEELFTHRQLLCLSELYFYINKVSDLVSRDLLRYAFSATLYMCNRTFISTKNRKESRGGSSIFSIYRYKVAKRTVELNPFIIFKGRVSKLIKCKKETNQLIGAWPGAATTPDFSMATRNG